MYWLTRGTAYGADRESLWRFLGVAVVAFALAFDDDLYLSVEASGAALDQRDVGRQTHLVDMASRIDIVQRIEDELEAGKPINVELWIFDVGMMCLQLDVRIEFGGALFCDL